ncbi:hypothetical protein KDH_39780 [Dictyobacter sp. S3.2.2.5]|uniref:Uncharacterized protein n=1 Tax=Dictyobacter halimunensis TaxID=3026934 RepID=A0ABQ6FSA7_9CHLR|nr:hypothetical protein KDH_39780 [Dictyobacter sp. S3.2.2.5]
MENKDYIDASLGLAFSLGVFERYRRNGLLQANDLRHVPGIRGRCTGYLQLVEGKVTACYVQEQNGKRHPITIDVLIRLDGERGPFQWVLHPLPAPPTSHPDKDAPSEQEQKPPIPRQIARLNVDNLIGWTTIQKLMLQSVYEQIDGRRDITDIKKAVPLSSNVVDEALRILFSLKVIIFITPDDQNKFF